MSGCAMDATQGPRKAGMRDHIPRVAGFAQAGQTSTAGKVRTIRARGGKDRPWQGMARGCDIAKGGNACGDRMRDCMAWHAVAGYDAGCGMAGDAG